MKSIPVVQIAVGSSSPHKIDAVQQAASKFFTACGISNCPAKSGVGIQPIGLEETLKGAQNRALAAAQKFPNAICVGIESGIVKMGLHWFDIAVVVVRRHETESVSVSAGIRLPDECVSEAIQRGLERTTVGSVVAEFYHGDETDPHTRLSRGKVTRMQTLTEAVFLAFSQIKFPVGFCIGDLEGNQ
ncbi:MAG TPA: inosine/xanthosine triphosphatase [Patescibacteria group bacterium]|nr:inosine/xanthosine triphosphatase [Patescibacteria group bacterium]